MKKIKSKLFQEFEMIKDKQSNVIGGFAINTSSGSDTNTTGGYDISFDTLDSQGNFVIVDTPLTGTKTSTVDKPGC